MSSGRHSLLGELEKMSGFYVNFYFKNIEYDDGFYGGEFSSPDSDVYCEFLPARGAFATDLDTPPPRVVPGAPPVPLRSDFIRTMSKSDPSEELRGATTPRAGGLTRRTCVCYASFRLLRSFTLQCTRKRSVAEGEGAQ